MRVFAIDYRSLALFRCLLAATVIWRLIDLLPHASVFFSDQGIFPRSLQLRHTNPDYFSVLFLNGTRHFVFAVFAVHFLAAFSLLLGFRARLSAFICWTLAVSLSVRASAITTGADGLQLLLLFWAMLLPIGRVFSIDAAKKAANEHPDYFTSLASAGLILQSIYVYVFGALLKEGDPWRLDKTAVHTALQLNDVAREGLRQYVSLETSYYITPTVFTLEICAAIFLLFPIANKWLRHNYAALLIIMHLGFAIFLDIGQFWLISIASLSVFLSHQFWAQFHKVYWPSSSHRIKIYYDEDCRFCLATSQLLKTAFLPSSCEALPAQTEPEIYKVMLSKDSWVVRTDGQTIFTGWDALVLLSRQGIITKPLYLIFLLVQKLQLGGRIYSVVGRNRAFLSRYVSISSRQDCRKSRALTVLGFFALTYSFASNLETISCAQNERCIVPGPIQRLGNTLHLTQRWSMFAPEPPRFFVTPRVELEHASGIVTAVLDDSNTSYSELNYPSLLRKSRPWNAYFVNLSTYSTISVQEEYFKSYATFLCANSPRETRIHRVAILLTPTEVRGRLRIQTAETKQFRFACPASL